LLFRGIIGCVNVPQCYVYIACLVLVHKLFMPYIKGVLKFKRSNISLQGYVSTHMFWFVCCGKYVRST